MSSVSALSFSGRSSVTTATPSAAVRTAMATSGTPRQAGLDDDLDVVVGVGQPLEGLSDTVQPDLSGDQLPGVDLARCHARQADVVRIGCRAVAEVDEETLVRAHDGSNGVV